MNGTTLFESDTPNPINRSSSLSNKLGSSTPSDSCTHAKQNLFSCSIVEDLPKTELPRKKIILFETMRKEPSQNQSLPLHQIKRPFLLTKEEDKFKEQYFDLLIASATKLLSSGNVKLDYLNAPTYPKCTDISYSTNVEDDLSLYSRKCENKICAVIVDKQDKIYHAQITSSYKSRIYLLCEKCYLAWKQEHYCYYCNVIYRDFSFNQQYYDQKIWIQCDYCERWQHIQCEENKGNLCNIEEMNRDEDFKYKCPFCRNETVSSAIKEKGIII